MIQPGVAFFHWSQVVNPGLKDLVGQAIAPFYSFSGDPRPRIAYTKISAPRIRHHRGIEQRRVRLQLNVFANTAEQLALIVEQIEEIEGASGTWDGQVVKNVQIEDDRDDLSDEAGNLQKKPSTSFDLLMWMEN